MVKILFVVVQYNRDNGKWKWFFSLAFVYVAVAIVVFVSRSTANRHTYIHEHIHHTDGTTEWNEIKLSEMKLDSTELGRFEIKLQALND